MKVFIKKGRRLLLRKFIGKGSNFFVCNEVIKLENDVIVFLNCLWNGPWTTI
jgi:hypothetical protein